MRKFLALCGAVLCLPVVAAAQDNSAALASSAESPASPTPSPARYPSGDTLPWQLSVQYLYIRVRPGTGSGFNLHGFDTSVIRYANHWFGIEGNVGAAFGYTPSSLTTFNPTAQSLRTKFIVYGGGPHVTHRTTSRIEPWGHALFGATHLRMTQASIGPASANAFTFAVGGGADFKIRPRLFWRAGGDLLVTRFFGEFQKNFQIKTGLVLNF